MLHELRLRITHDVRQAAHDSCFPHMRFERRVKYVSSPINADLYPDMTHDGVNITKKGRGNPRLGKDPSDREGIIVDPEPALKLRTREAQLSKFKRGI